MDKPATFSYNGTQHSYVPARPHRLTVRTPGFHPGNPGSIPGEVTTNISYAMIPCLGEVFLFAVLF